jgi:hypothetical protein
MRVFVCALVAGWCTLSVGGAAQVGGSLPETAALLEGVRKRLARNAALQSRFVFMERRTALRRLSDGTFEPEETKLFEVYPSAAGDLTYRRLVATNGVPTPPDELARADRQQLAARQEYIRKVRAESSRDRQRRLDREAEARAREQAVIDDVLSVLAFSVVRRVMVDGRPTIVVSFEPVDDPKPTTREGEMVSHFSGRGWVDERDLQVIRVEAEARDTILFGLGLLARISKGTRVEYVRRPMVDGAWLPARTEYRGTGRMLLFRKLDLAWVSEYFDYERLDPERLPSFIALPDDVQPEPHSGLAPPQNSGSSLDLVNR